jgi:alpha-mannosidase
MVLEAGSCAHQQQLRPQRIKETALRIATPLVCGMVVLSSLFTVNRLQAQLFEATHGHNAPISLSHDEQATVDRLGSLEQLPDGPWRFFTGTVTHGEDPSLDDSSWQTAEGKSTGPKEAVWYRRAIVVPNTLHGYDLTGARIWFQFQAYGNGPVPQIIYFNGRRVAMGDDLEPIVLFDQAKPGDKVLVAVKLLATVDDKHVQSADMPIEFTASRPNPADVRTEFQSAAALLPSLSTNESADQATLAKAIGQVNIAALDKADQAQFDASLKEAQQTLTALKPTLDQARMHLTGNSHIDAAWLWPWTETVDVVKRTFGTAVQLMNEYPAYTYSQSAAVYNQWMADKYPELNQQIKQRIQDGRWELVGGMWLEPDLNMPDGESLVRQLLIGQATFQKLYGTTTRIGWNPDSFGYTWQLPQIYKRSGIDYFVTQKMTWNDTNQLPLKLFWWASPDGSKVLSYFPHDYANNNLDPLRLARDLAVARERAPGMTEMMDLYGIGDHGGGPTRVVLDEGNRWMQLDKVVVPSEFGTAQPFFTKTEQQIAPQSPTWNYRTLARGETQLPAPAAGQISIPTWQDELYLEYHRGVYTTQADHKRNMRDSEEWVLNAEKYASLAWLDGQPYPAQELTDAWKHVLFNQFHDLAAGSGIATIYREAQKDYDQVHWATNEVSTKSLNTLAARVNTVTPAGSVPVMVVNPLAWERSGLTTVEVQMPNAAAGGVSILDAQNRVVPSQTISSDARTHTYRLLVRVDNAPSMGYTLLHAVAGHRPFATEIKTTVNTIENAALRVTLNPANGCITSLYDKKANYELIATGGCANELQAFKDTPKEYDAWNIDPGTLDRLPTLLEDADSVKLIEQGPLRATIRVTRHWQRSKFVQDISVDSGGSQVLIDNDIDWHETHVLLKAAFPLAASAPFATYEIPYGTIERPTTRNNSFEKAKFEVPAMRWADLGDGQHGLSLINDSKYGYDSVGNQLRLTLLRSPTWPDPEADREHHHFRFALYPHTGDWKQALSVRHGYEFNYRLQAMQLAPHAGSLPPRLSFASIAESNVVLTAMKQTEDGKGLLVRFYEWAGKGGNVTVTVPPGAKAASVANLMERPEGAPLALSNNTVSVPVTPYQIQTVRLDYTPEESASASRKQ